MQLDVTSPRNPGPPVKAAITRTVSADPLPVATFTATELVLGPLPPVSVTHGEDGEEDRYQPPATLIPGKRSATGDTPARACLALADVLWPAKAAVMKPAKADDTPAVTP